MQQKVFPSLGRFGPLVDASDGARSCEEGGSQVGREGGSGSDAECVDEENSDGVEEESGSWGVVFSWYEDEILVSGVFVVKCFGVVGADE